ncbi:tRNA threonylcarbamoyladenosine dehydratase [Verrucomicrobiaceae bacterium 227]
MRQLLADSGLSFNPHVSLESAVTDDYLNRFGGIARLYGIAALEKFSESHVMIVGLGGVGSWTVEALARSGVGKLSLVDLDDLCVTNTNRQIHATTATIGHSKATALADRVALINPDAEVVVQQSFYTREKSEALLTPPPHAVVDAIDSVRQKCHLIATCRALKIPVIVSGGAGGRIDATKIQIDDLAKTHGDALLLAVRRTLRDDYRFPKSENKKTRKFRIPAVFSSEQPRFPTCEGDTTTTRPETIVPGIKCDAGYGAATHLTATFGNIMAGWILDQLVAR